ncbi:uncharacterized protein LOC130726266 [Lotus japonicus]|uniref:uncharacterized protein LOC130726266 n=1 Tax=Lotus japonicus TaxID=34305 RepID=UPI0025865D1B|nr:uncharacterized protein LOC130726266 [Lotus japonicus]
MECKKCPSGDLLKIKSREESRKIITSEFPSLHSRLFRCVFQTKKMMNQSKQVASLTTSRLSPLAEPFTLNRSPYQQQPPTSYSSSPLDDPFSSLLDSFLECNMGSISKSHSVGDSGFRQETVIPTLPLEIAEEKSIFEQHPSLELPSYGEFNGPLFDVSLPANSPSVTGLGYGIQLQGVDFHQGLFGKGNDDAGTSVADSDAGKFQKGKHAVDELTPSLTMSEGILEKNTGIIVANDILSNSEGIVHTADEYSSFLISNCKVAPLKLSTTDMSSTKSTPQNHFSPILDDNDPDVDSPCWKGTAAFSLPPSEISGSLQIQHIKKEAEKHNILNPLAPQFFPGIGYIKDDFVPYNSSAHVATNFFSGEDIFMESIMVESPVELNKKIELQNSSNICGREKALNVLNDPKRNLVDSVLMTQSSSKEECLTSKGKHGTVVDVDDFVKGNKNSKASRSMGGVFPAEGHSPTLPASSSKVNIVTDLFKTFEGVSKSLIESQKPDIKIILRAMHVLSELLVHVDGTESYDEHDPDVIMIPQIINNLNGFSTKKCGQRISTLDSTPADSTFCPDRLLELPKELEMKSIEALVVPSQLYLQNDYTGKNTVSKVIGQSGQSSFASRSDEGTKKADEMAQLQVIRRSLGRSLDIDKQMHPEALLFWNLWLDSEAERCYRKYKTYNCLMEAGVEVDCKNVAELWR